MSQITDIAASTETRFTKSPYLPQNPVEYYSVAGATLYGVYLPGRDARDGDYQRWEGDGTTVTWDEDEIVNLANADTTAGITDANALTVVVLVDGEPLNRIATSGTPGAGEFEVVDNGGTTELTLGEAPAAGAKVEVFLIDAADIESVTLVATTPKQGKAYEVVRSTAALQAKRLTR